MPGPGHRALGKQVFCWVPDAQAQEAPRNHSISFEVHELDYDAPGGTQVSCVGSSCAWGHGVVGPWLG